MAAPLAMIGRGRAGRGGGLGGVSAGTLGEKRRIGGHFGAAVGASTKRGRAAWREEVQDEEGSAESPGTPLPSESEAAADAPSEAPEAEAEAEAPEGKGEAAPRAALVTLELLVAGSVVGELQVLLQAGGEERLAACAQPEGGAVALALRGVVCTFGGHEPLPGAKAGESAAEPERELEGVVIDSAPGEGPGLARPAGLLLSPPSGLGLALTLPAAPGAAPAALAALDGHRVLGAVLLGRRMLQRLSILAPVAGGQAPVQSVSLRLAGPPQEALAGARQPFALDGAAPDSELSETLELCELELTARDAEVSELKQAPFSRERQSGVAAIEAILEALEGRLGKPAKAAEPIDAASGDPLAARRSWLQQQLQHLLRVLRKLR